jgi:hypothetical protein
LAPSDISAPADAPDTFSSTAVELKSPLANVIVFILTSYRYWLKPGSLVDSQIESHIDIGLKTVHNVALKKW